MSDYQDIMKELARNRANDRPSTPQQLGSDKLSQAKTGNSVAVVASVSSTEGAEHIRKYSIR